MGKTIVIYHRSDFDGIFCREIAKHFMPEAELIGWDYGDPVPTPDVVSADDTLYMLDISIEGLMGHPKLIWIDHHKSAIEKFTGLPPNGISGYRIDGVAACRLAWQWFLIDSGHHDGDIKFKLPNGVAATNFSLPDKQDFIDRKVSEPTAVRLAGEYDIWDKSDPDAELFQHGLRSQDLSGWFEAMLSDEATATIAEIENRLEKWSKFELLPNGNIKVPGLGDRVVKMLLKNGKAIQYTKTQENESIITSYGFTFQWEGLTFLACNHARFNSHLFTAGIKPEHDALFGFNWSGKDWRVSLYGIPGKDIDLSVIAVKYGGGGHAGACGMRLKTLPF
jgi:uncharacterized protein